MKVTIVGGGIGGLGAGIACALRGCAVSVLEQAPALTEVGAGLQISPNGWRVLVAMGVAPLLADTAFEPDAIEMRIGQTGRRVFRLPMRGYAQNRWGAPYMHVHRADLVTALNARLDQLAPGAVRTGVVARAYTPDGTVHLDSGEMVRSDLVIGADGLHSVVRRQMLGPDALRYTGNVAWRAVVPVEALGTDAPPPTACVWVGQGRHAVTTRLRAGKLANFVGMVEQAAPAEEGWRSTGTAAQAAADFAGWHPTITRLIGQAEVLHRWALFDRTKLPRWHDGRVTLLGDAAHPMLPSMAQGAVQALEDAWCLAGLVTTRGSVEAALAQYYALRIDRTARIQRGSAANARMFHHASPLGRLAFYGPMGIGARLLPDLIHRRQDWVYRHDVTAEVPPL
ncbi:FAD-dependent monooxygenase [uncultured Tateyamaria sp.]|uniref:FAD-dependent monooxygenase n=1 Tax=Tateyamaria sp. 1078 TaxID=3417464 RepID=UPI00261F4A5A|nr:FAD-dependent monooxygenase [uncultured Tateyamaria sp.]